MAGRSSVSRYQNYGHYRPSREDTTESRLACISDEKEPNQAHHASSSRQQQQDYSAVHVKNGVREPIPAVNGQTNPNSRLEYIINAMAYIRGELDDLKESDRILLEIFKQLENNVAELNDNITNWRFSGAFLTPGRITSFTDLDFASRGSSYQDQSNSNAMNSLETSFVDSTLDSIKEDKTSDESDSLLLPELEGSSMSCSPVLNSLRSHTSAASINGSNGAKGSSDSTPQLKTSASFNKLPNSPSISRLQDETGSNISRNSSIDSGIQFASEAENGSTNGVHLAVAEPEDREVRKSVGFADDIFAALGL